MCSVGWREVSWKVKQGHEEGVSVLQKLQHDITQLLYGTGWGEGSDNDKVKLRIGWVYFVNDAHEL
jgi:hypothetical protein